LACLILDGVLDGHAAGHRAADELAEDVGEGEAPAVALGLEEPPGARVDLEMVGLNGRCRGEVVTVTGVVALVAAGQLRT
jgi:hypothetical protein